MKQNSCIIQLNVKNDIQQSFCMKINLYVNNRFLLVNNTILSFHKLNLIDLQKILIIIPKFPFFCIVRYIL